MATKALQSRSYASKSLRFTLFLQVDNRKAHIASNAIQFYAKMRVSKLQQKILDETIEAMDVFCAGAGLEKPTPNEVPVFYGISFGLRSCLRVLLI
jgi:hypothetical protein